MKNRDYKMYLQDVLSVYHVLKITLSISFLA